MLVLETEKYIRKPLYVDAIRVTEENFNDVLSWCEGTVETESGGPREGKPFIKVNVHGVPKSQRQTKAFYGDWLLHTERGFKVYTDNAFRASFNSVVEETKDKVPNDVPRSSGVVALGTQPITPPEGVAAELVRPPVVPQVRASESALAAAKEELEVVNEQQPITVSDSDSAPPPQTEDGRRILTSAEQLEMDPSEITELLRSGQVVLAQDLV